MPQIQFTNHKRQNLHSTTLHINKKEKSIHKVTDQSGSHQKKKKLIKVRV